MFVFSSVVFSCLYLSIINEPLRLFAYKQGCVQTRFNVSCAAGTAPFYQQHSKREEFAKKFNRFFCETRIT